MVSCCAGPANQADQGADRIVCSKRRAIPWKTLAETWLRPHGAARVSKRNALAKAREMLAEAALGESATISRRSVLGHGTPRRDRARAHQQSSRASAR